MTTTARVVVLPQHSSELKIESIELPEPGAEQVVVKQFASGICHSQLHQIHRPRHNPVILGHESTGVVTQVGARGQTCGSRRHGHGYLGTAQYTERNQAACGSPARSQRGRCEVPERVHLGRPIPLLTNNTL